MKDEHRLRLQRLAAHPVLDPRAKNELDTIFFTRKSVTA
jgi:hypothetical protein